MDGRVERVHTLDAAQLLSFAAGAKYTQSGIAALVDVVAKCRAKALARLVLFRWTLFNALIGNRDAHLKNLSLFVSRKGYALAPHYDLVSTAAWARPELASPGEATWPDIGLSYAIGQAKTYGELTAQDFAAFGAALGLDLGLVGRELKTMTNRILPAAHNLLDEHQARTDVPRERRAGELHMLRSIIWLPIADMQKKLSAAL